MKTHVPVRVSARRLSEGPPPRSTCRPGRRLQLQVRFDRRGVHRTVVRGQRGERPSSLAAPQPPTLGRLAGPSCRRSAARPARPPGRATRSRTAAALPCRPRAAPLKRTPVSLRSSKRPSGQRAVHPPVGTLPRPHSARPGFSGRRLASTILLGGTKGHSAETLSSFLSSCPLPAHKLPYSSAPVPVFAGQRRFGALGMTTLPCHTTITPSARQNETATRSTCSGTGFPLLALLRRGRTLPVHVRPPLTLRSAPSARSRFPSEPRARTPRRGRPRGDPRTPRPQGVLSHGPLFLPVLSSPWSRSRVPGPSACHLSS